MTPREKAKQLHADIYKIVSDGKASHNPYMGIEYIPELWEIAKSCALITIYEILNNEEGALDYESDIQYWKEVKKEIEIL